MPQFAGHAKKALEKIKISSGQTRVVVIGDVILDRFLYGVAERISPEAPVPVVDVSNETQRLGGSANVVRNLRALGAQVTLVGVLGDDSGAKRIRELLNEVETSQDGLVVDTTRPTAVKTRVFAQHQQVVRFDREGKGALDGAATAKLVANATAAVAGASAVIISDYAKGVVCPEVLDCVRPLAAKGLPVTVDPKPANAGMYKGLGVITPNAKETLEMSGVFPGEDEDAVRAGSLLVKKLELSSILVTRGERGMTLVDAEGDAEHIPTRAKDVFDVTGAGDTAISVFTLAWASGATLLEAAALANLASGIVVGKLGTAVVDVDELEKALG